MSPRINNLCKRDLYSTNVDNLWRCEVLGEVPVWSNDFSCSPIGFAIADPGACLLIETDP